MLAMANRPQSVSEAFLYRGKKMLGVYVRPGGRKKKFPGVLFLHGLPGSEKNVDIQRELMARGVASFALYFAGAWGSGGVYRPTTLVDQAAAGLRHLAKHPEVDARRLAVFGFSMGGWTALHLGARTRNLRAVAAVAPAGGAEMVTPWLKGFAEEAAAILNAGSASALYKDMVQAAVKTDPAESAARLKMPLLLIHGTEDDVVPFSVSERIYAAARKNTTFVKVAGADHTFLDRRAWLTRRVSSWLAQKLR